MPETQKEWTPEELARERRMADNLAQAMGAVANGQPSPRVLYAMGQMMAHLIELNKTTASIEGTLIALGQVIGLETMRIRLGFGIGEDQTSAGPN